MDLTTTRRELSANLHDARRPQACDESAVELLLLVYEELTSNAQRHARPPIEVTVTDTGDQWFLMVGDASIDVPPVPAAGRDAADGGLGLFMVAELAKSHGWTVERDRKVVWAILDITADRAPIPSPRDDGAGECSSDAGSHSAP